jgi:hypothetical protein
LLACFVKSGQLSQKFFSLFNRNSQDPRAIVHENMIGDQLRCPLVAGIKPLAFGNYA